MTTPAQQKAKAKAFVARWKAADGNEDREARSFWIEFAQELLGMPNVTHVLDFERHVKGRKADVFYEDMGILIENKSRNCSLDERYERSKKAGLETPYEQAKWYADNLPHSIRPRYLLTCNFDEIRIHDLEKEHPGSDYVSVALDELPDNLYLFGFFVDKTNSRIEKEKNLSVKAGELVGRLYDELSKQYQNIDTDENEQHSLNVLCVRLVFLLYAEDAGLLARRNQFYDYLKTIPANRMRNALIELFDVLDTPIDERDPYIEESLKDFPYVNGGLFSRDERIVIPQLTDQIRVDLLAEASAGFNWSDISPTIFGAAFESTLNPETRRSGGMHYTSPENIHKVIDPLFLDDLKAELAVIEGEKVERARIQKLRTFQRKLASLTFLDPAAGSHNFLTETYISLRKLELRIIENLHGDQTSFDAVENPIMVNIGQFYAIEINDFAVSVGKTALWIAEQQMMEKTQELLPYQTFEFLPLKSITNSVCANALRIDWNDVLPAEKCSYIIGNPPFYGHQDMDSRQHEDLDIVLSDCDKHGKLDYVSGWYAKAIEYANENPISCAFVSTNSICQGEQVGILWDYLFSKDVVIQFAHRSFVWNNEATDQAHVHCVIVGFGKSSQSEKRIFQDGYMEVAETINGYLFDGPRQSVASRSKNINVGFSKTKLVKGSQPTDGGNLLFEAEEGEAFMSRWPKQAHLLKKFIGADEFIKGTYRYCLWLKDADPSEYDGNPEIHQRLSSVRDKRAASPTASVRRASATPHLFTQIRQPQSDYLLFPRHSSGRRRFLPIGFVSPDVIASDAASFIPDASLYLFGVLSSTFHNAWMRVVCGRLKSDYRYSPAVFNSFAFPDADEEQIGIIESCAQAVLDTRSLYPDKSLAWLYDPDTMPSDLLAAHKELDRAVEAAYGVGFDGDEEKIVAHLFRLYAEMTKE